MRLGLRVGTGATPVQPRSQAKHVIPSKKERRSARATAARASTSQEAPTEEQRKGFLRLIAEAKASENQARMLRTAMRELERELSEWEGKAKKARSRAAELAPEMAREMAETDEHSLQEQAKHLLQSLKGVDMRKVVVSQHAIHHSDAVLVAAVAPHSRADGRPGAAIGLLLDPATLPVPAVNDLKIHWGCCTGPGRAWKPPPAGWSTLPDKSQDSGGGAWRTPTLLLDGGALGARIQIALDGPLQSGGLAFALVADASHRAKWLKGEGGRDFFLDLKTVAKAAGVVPPRDSNGSAHRGQNGSSARRGKDAKGSASLLDGLDSVEEVEELLHLPLQEVDEQSQPHLLKAEPSALTQPSRWNGAVAEDVINAVAAVEHKAERSLMHRYDLAHNALDECLGKLPSSPDLAAEARAASGVAAISLWLRFAAARHLRWNVNYNVKPREISAAQDRLTSLLGQASQHHPSLADLLRVGMLAVGRGGAGDVGQRVRDEILSIQSRNHAKGGMMEEWHQKLHNNTSPDDVVICQALLAYLNSGLDISQYWAALEQANITRERLASFDRPIVSEPCFSEDQVEGLKMDLERYLRTLKAVHSGDDLEMAAKVVLGYQERTMKGKVVEVPPVKALVGDDRLRKLLQAILLIQHQGWHLRMQPPSQREAAAALERINGLGDASGSVAVAGVANAQLQQPIASWGLGGSTLYYLELLLEGRHLINDALASGAVEERIRDCVYLDLAMETATRSTLEALLPHLRTAMAAGPASDATTLGWTWATQVLQLAVHGLCLSWRDNAEILSALKQLSRLQRQHASNAAATSTTSQWGNLLAIQLQAVVERLSRSLGAYAERCMSVLEPSSIALAGQLRVPRDAAKLMGEEVVRGTLAAPIAQMLAAMEQHLLEAAGRGCWTIISPAQGQCGGRLAVVRRLRDVTHKSFNEPCVLVVAEEVNGDEDVPLGTVALVTPSRLDVLCHSAVRARNSGVLLATCTDRAELESWCALDGRPVSVTITGAPPQVLCTADDAALGHGTPGGRAMAPGLVRFQPHPWCNRWTVSEDCEENLEGKGGAKSCNLLALKVLQNDSSVPITSRVPQGMTVPFGAFEAVLDSAGNEDVQQELQRLKHEVARAYPENRAVILQQIRNLVTSRLLPPPSLLPELISAIRQMSASSPVAAVSDIGLPQGGSEGAFLEWQSGLWCSVTRVWASKWNDTAYSASARVGAEHDDIRMAVLCQEVLKARYSFVAHSCDPTTGDAGTMLIEMAPGLGEALVSNHPGQPFSFSVNKPKLRAAFQAVWSAIDAVAPFPAGDADQQGTHLNGASAWGGAAPEAAGRSEQDTVQLRVALARRLYGLEHEFKSLQGGAIGSSRCAELEAMDCSTLREAFRDCFTVLTLPSKSSALMMQSQSDQHPTHGGGAGSSATLPDLICRSDSNAEDLPDYAGAGVFDSVMLRPPLEVRCEYAEEPLIWDEEFQLKLMTALACACLEVEQAMAPVPQDIEGAVVWDTAAQDGYVAVVQTRPQA